MAAAPLDWEYLRRDDFFWSRVETGARDECWPWMLSIGNHGYGQTTDGQQRTRLAHRCAWELHNRRRIPRDMTIDHKCRNRPCCNPHHLRLRTNRTNARDNGHSTKTHCPRGHPYNRKNTLWSTRVNGLRCRKCRQCNRERYDPVKRRARYLASFG